jgi:hypothetical protein
MVMLTQTLTKRAGLLLCPASALTLLQLSHKSYHHFLGNGLSDSELDVLLLSYQDGVTETIDKIEYSLDNPMVDSHHDLLVSTMSIPSLPPSPTQRPSKPQSPQVPNTRQKIIWSEDGIQNYHKIVTHHLSHIRECWLDHSSPSSMSTTNNDT